MRSKNTKNEMTQNNGLLIFSSRVLCIFFLFIFQNIQASSTIIDEKIIYSEDENTLSKVDSVSHFEDNQSTAKIYISSGVKITNLDSENNYEIVKILPLQNKKIEPKKNSVLNIAKAELEKKVEEKIVSKPENPAIIHEVFSTPKTDVYFSFVEGFSKITVPVSQFSAKQIINPENYKTSLALCLSKLTSVYFKNAELLTAQNKSAFSVRPPPISFTI